MADLDALWAFRFEDFEKCGMRNGGTMVLLGSRLFGGDSHFYYTGEYEVNGSKVSGSGRLTHYSGRSLTAYGMLIDDPLEIEFLAELADDRIAGYMWPARRGEPMLRYTMDRLESLG